MAETYIAPNTTDPQLVPKIFSAQLMRKSIGESFFIGKFAAQEFLKTGDGSLVGTDPNKPIQILRDLERVAGDTIQYDLIEDIRGDGVYGDNILRGKEKNLSFFTDQVHIDQVRQGVDAGGRMTRKRTKHDLRIQARRALTRWFARYFDEALTCYLAGIRGEATEQWVLPTTWNGFAGNPLQINDDAHEFTIDSGNAISHDPADATTLTLQWFDRLKTYISLMDYPLNPIYDGAEPIYVVVLHPKAVEQLRTSTATNSWLEIQKHAGVRGTDNPIFKDSLGKYGRFVLHEYSKVPYKTYGGKKVAHCMVLGAQAAVVAFGDAGGKFGFSWHEEMEDRGNRLVVDAGTILGIKKCVFNNQVFGTITMYVDITD